jgi:hypothetical protein
MTVDTLRSSSNVGGESLSDTKINGTWMDARNGRSFRPDFDESGQDLHCIPIQRVTIPFDTSDNLFGCILLQPTGLKKGQFRRYGWMCLDCDYFKIETWENIQSEEWLEFEERNLNGVSTITVI